MLPSPSLIFLGNCSFENKNESTGNPTTKHTAAVNALLNVLDGVHVPGDGVCCDLDSYPRISHQEVKAPVVVCVCCSIL